MNTNTTQTTNNNNQTTRKHTQTLVSWGANRLITVEVLARWWLLYVQTAIVFAVAALTLTFSDRQMIDRAQRRAARMLLGHDLRSPTPSSLMTGVAAVTALRVIAAAG